MVEFEGFEERVIEAYREWASKQPDPNAIAVCVVGGMVYSVRELAEEVKNRTPYGLHHIEMARHFAEVYPAVGPNGVIKMLLGESLEEKS